MHRLFILLQLAAMALAVTPAVQAADPLEGHSGEALLRAVRHNYHPTTLCAPDGETLVRLTTQYDTYPAADGNLMLRDRMRADDCPYTEVQGRLYYHHVAQPSWWADPGEAADTIARDMHNIFAARWQDVADINNDVITWVLADIDPADDGSYRADVTAYEGYPDLTYACYTPPLRWRGDFARALLYMITIYPSVYWHLDCRPLLTRSAYPMLSENARQMLLSWHRADPVDDVERARSQAVKLLQGNANPLVERPELVEYLWGSRQGETLDPEEVTVPGRLRGTYHRSADRYVWLLSPHVPDGAVWSLDGQSVSDDHLELEHLADGPHTLRYTAPDGERGAITITILP